MLNRTYISAALLGVFLAGPAIADDRPPGRHPVVRPDIGALTVDSDFTVFMHKDVPESVRRAALRRLWVLMQLPVSCDELCVEAEPAGSSFAQLASEKRSVAAR
jgi:hypothetical protein